MASEPNQVPSSEGPLVIPANIVIGDQKAMPRKDAASILMQLKFGPKDKLQKAELTKKLMEHLTKNSGGTSSAPPVVNVVKVDDKKAPATEEGSDADKKKSAENKKRLRPPDNAAAAESSSGSANPTPGMPSPKSKPDPPQPQITPPAVGKPPSTTNGQEGADKATGSQSVPPNINPNPPSKKRKIQHPYQPGVQVAMASTARPAAPSNNPQGTFISTSVAIPATVVRRPSTTPGDGIMRVRDVTGAEYHQAVEYRNPNGKMMVVQQPPPNLLNPQISTQGGQQAIPTFPPNAPNMAAMHITQGQTTMHRATAIPATAAVVLAAPLIAQTAPIPATVAAPTKRRRREGGSSGSKSQVCSECGKRFSTGGNLSRHMLTHSDQRPFSCGICFKSFRQRVHLKKHIRLHTGEKPYSCSYCNKSFTQKSTLTGHIRTKHTGETPYKCPDCARQFPTRNHLRAHRNKCLRSNGQPVPPRKKAEKKTTRTLPSVVVSNAQVMAAAANAVMEPIMAQPLASVQGLPQTLPPMIPHALSAIAQPFTAPIISTATAQSIPSHSASSLPPGHVLASGAARAQPPAVAQALVQGDATMKIETAQTQPQVSSTMASAPVPPTSIPAPMSSIPPAVSTSAQNPPTQQPWTVSGLSS